MAAIVSTAVMAWAKVIVVVEVRRWLQGRRAHRGLMPAEKPTRHELYAVLPPPLFQGVLAAAAPPGLVAPNRDR